MAWGTRLRRSSQEEAFEAPRGKSDRPLSGDDSRVASRHCVFLAAPAPARMRTRNPPMREGCQSVGSMFFAVSRYTGGDWSSIDRSLSMFCVMCLPATAWLLSLCIAMAQRPFVVVFEPWTNATREQRKD